MIHLSMIGFSKIKKLNYNRLTHTETEHTSLFKIIVDGWSCCEYIIYDQPSHYTKLANFNTVCFCLHFIFIRSGKHQAKAR